MRRVESRERRARLARRHALAPGHDAADVVDAARRLVALHASDPSTVYLSARARLAASTVADLDRALYADRTLVKHLSMRRTLFVFPRETLAAAQAGASARVAAAEWGRVVRDVEKAGLHTDGATWLRGAWQQVLAALAGGREATMAQLRDEVSELAGTTTYAAGRTWGGELPLAPRVLTTLSAAGHVLRATNVGGWTTSRPRWAATSAWLGAPIAAIPQREGTAALVEAWLRAFGPGTAADLKWWLGSTVRAVSTALADVGAVEVALEGDRVGYLLPDDVEPAAPVDPWAALLPGLDPTPMGWAERDFYLGPHKEQVFDRNGNVGPTAWWDGRIVGGWRQDAGGEVVVQLLEDVDADARAALEGEAQRLTAWLAGVRVMPRFPSPLFTQR